MTEKKENKITYNLTIEIDSSDGLNLKVCYVEVSEESVKKALEILKEKGEE